MIFLKSGRPNTLERVDIKDRVGTGGVKITIWEEPGHPEGGPMALLPPGFLDDAATSREPAAKKLAGFGIRAAVVKHTGKGGLTAFHAREQRSMDVHRAIRIVEKHYRPDYLVVAGHSFGGPNSNDAANHRIRTHQSHEGKAPKLAVVHEAAPGLGSRPFDPNEVDMKQEFCSMARHPLEMLALAGREAPHLWARMLSTLTALGEMASLTHIHIQPGKDTLLAAGVPVYDMFYSEDGLVKMPSDCADNPETTVFPGSHLESYFQPALLAGHIIDKVLPDLGL